MKERLKTLIAFSVIGIAVITALVLSGLDKSSDIYPTEVTKIRLYGERHGSKLYYDIELELWRECYDKGYRALFLVLPYYIDSDRFRADPWGRSHRHTLYA